MMAERSDNVAKVIDALTEALDAGRVEGLLDGETGSWIPPEAVLTVAEANVPCEPGSTAYVLVSDLAPDLPVAFCFDHPVTEGQTPREMLMDLCGELTHIGCLGRCRVCREPVAPDEMAIVLGRTGEPSKRFLLHILCAQTAGRAIRERLNG
jgi:hypothetical protein